MILKKRQNLCPNRQGIWVEDKTITLLLKNTKIKDIGGIKFQ